MAMIPIFALAAVAVAFLLFLSYQVWWQSSAKEEITDLSPVDLEAFRNLTDPQEVGYLRVNLSPKEFRRIQRLRLRTAAVYISAISRNAGRLLVVGRAVSAHPNPDIATSGLDVVYRALQLKMWCSFSLLQLGATFVFPTLLSPSSRIADHYRDVSSMTAALPRKMAA
jgi:hypothetical protein